MDGYRDAKGEKKQLGFPLFFVPTYAGKGQGQMFSEFPGLAFPALNLSAYQGDLRIDSGIPQNVYQLDTSKMTPFKDKNGDIFKQTLLPGETMTLPDGAGTVTFEKEIREWAGFQVSQQPGNGWALAGSVAALAGLVGSLFVQRRRVWVRAAAGEDGVTVIEMAGLGRSESAKLPEELAELAAELHAVALHRAGASGSGGRRRHRPGCSRRRGQAVTDIAAATNENLAQISNVLVYSAMAVYTLAFLAHITEWVLGSRSKVGRTAAALAPAHRTAAAPAVQVRTAGGGTQVLDKPKVVTRAAAGARDVPDGPGAAGGDLKGDLYGRIAVSSPPSRSCSNWAPSWLAPCRCSGRPGATCTSSR